MPGPVSDSYDPEFGTGDNAYAVADAMRKLVDHATMLLGDERKDIVAVARSKKMNQKLGRLLNEREWRIIRFALTRSLESI